MWTEISETNDNPQANSISLESHMKYTLVVGTHICKNIYSSIHLLQNIRVLSNQLQNHHEFTYSMHGN